MFQRTFITLAVWFGSAGSILAEPSFIPVERARMHPIERRTPAVDFFEGALLGNGGMGVVVTTRPDAIVMHFGHNSVWDIRIAEDNRDKIGTFQEIFKKVSAIPKDYKSLEEDPWYRDYVRMAHANYDKPYPRPFPCGSLLLGFDRHKVELLGHRLSIATGLNEVELLVENQLARLQIFCDMNADSVWVQLVDAQQKSIPNAFDRVRLIPDSSTPQEFPPYQVIDDGSASILSFRQTLPYEEPDRYDKEKGHPKDRAFQLSVFVNTTLKVNERINWEGNLETMGALERGFAPSDTFVLCAQLDQGLASEIKHKSLEIPQLTSAHFTSAFDTTSKVWEAYWNRSGVVLDDAVLERTWYWNHYFLNCAAKAGVYCPGLFANWSFQNIGTAWHGDYHLNYNIQQPFWVPFSSNRIEKHLPYVELVESLLPVSRIWAKEYYGLRGAYFPHSAYPVDMTMSPYPLPTWGWEICETPWAVQSLWWQYLYTMDREFLETRAFGPIKEAVLFLVDYMKRPEARGERWENDKYHIFPTVPPELYGLKPGFQYNYDCLVDLTLTKFVFKAYLQAVSILRLEKDERELTADIKDILEHFPDYPTAETPEGPVFVSVPGERADVVYNVPNSLMTVFPGEDHGLHSSPEMLAMLERTYRMHRNEGGNELVFLNLQAARIGRLDLDRFRRQIEYCVTANGTCADMVLQVHGRYGDLLKFDFMKYMGVWFENFSLPMVINECLMQSYNGTIRLFPNWPEKWKAEFHTLRSVGAFLVSASIRDGRVEWVEIVSEAGSPLRLIVPWKDGAVMETNGSRKFVRESVLELETTAGQTITLLPPQ